MPKDTVFITFYALSKVKGMDIRMKKFVLLIIMILNCIFSSTLLASDNYELNTISVN